VFVRPVLALLEFSEMNDIRDFLETNGAI